VLGFGGSTAEWLMAWAEAPNMTVEQAWGNEDSASTGYLPDPRPEPCAGDDGVEDDDRGNPEDDEASSAYGRRRTLRRGQRRCDRALLPT
jgi:hypothetical protein